MKNELLENYQEVIAKIYVAALRSLNRKVGREIFISMLKGRKDSKIIKGKYYENEYYGVFASFRGNEISNILNYLIEEGIILKETQGNICFIYTKEDVNSLYKYYYDFIGYISDNTMNMIGTEDEHLFLKLKNVRYSIALEKNLSPYNICSDEILREMCNRKPKNEDELDCIYGVGEKFIANYAKRFLNVINNNDEVY